MRSAGRVVGQGTPTDVITAESIAEWFGVGAHVFFAGLQDSWVSTSWRHLAEIAAPLSPSDALELGCGMGGDAMWLAQHGWRVLAVDVAANALEHAADTARQRGLDDRIDFQRHDLSDSFPTGPFDLASAQYLHSPVRLHRTTILQRATDAVRPGGTLLIVDHGSAAPWSWKVPEHTFQSPHDVLDALHLAEHQWNRVRVAGVDTHAVGPDGQTATVTDHIIAMRRE